MQGYGGGGGVGPVGGRLGRDGRRWKAELLLEAIGRLPETGGDVVMLTAVGMVGREAVLLVRKEARGTDAEEEVNDCAMTRCGGAHERGVMGGGVDGVGICLMLEEEVHHTEVAMSGGMEEAGVQGKAGLVVEQGFHEADLSLARSKEKETREIGGGQRGAGEEAAEERLATAAEGEVK